MKLFETPDEKYFRLAPIAAKQTLRMYEDLNKGMYIDGDLINSSYTDGNWRKYVRARDRILYMTIKFSMMRYLNREFRVGSVWNRRKRKAEVKLYYDPIKPWDPDSEPILVEYVNHKAPSPLEETSRRELWGIVEGIKIKGPGVYIVLRHYRDGIPIKEIAEEMGRSRTVVNTHKCRALKSIRKRLKGKNYDYC
jgi:hypothetical protein